MEQINRQGKNKQIGIRQFGSFADQRRDSVFDVWAARLGIDIQDNTAACASAPPANPSTNTHQHVYRVERLA